MWTWIIVGAIVVAIATLIMWRRRTRKGTGGTPDNMRARAGKTRKVDGGKPGGFPGTTGGSPPVTRADPTAETRELGEAHPMWSTAAARRSPPTASTS